MQSIVVCPILSILDVPTIDAPMNIALKLNYFASVRGWNQSIADLKLMMHKLSWIGLLGYFTVVYEGVIHI